MFTVFFLLFSRNLSPDLYTHFAQNNIDMELLASKWFVCLFTDVLPVEVGFFLSEKTMNMTSSVNFVVI